MFFIDVDSTAAWHPGFWMSQADMEELRTSPDHRRTIQGEWAQLQADREQLKTQISKGGGDSFPLPVNLERLIWNAQKIFHCVKPRVGANNGESLCIGMHADRR